jgi:hypothetical protein
MSKLWTPKDYWRKEIIDVALKEIDRNQAIVYYHRMDCPHPEFVPKGNFSSVCAVCGRNKEFIKS